MVAYEAEHQKTLHLNMLRHRRGQQLEIDAVKGARTVFLHRDILPAICTGFINIITA